MSVGESKRQDLSEIRWLQQESRLRFLDFLARECCDRFLDAASLIEVEDERSQKVEERRLGGFELSHLHAVYGIITERYLREVYDPQMRFGEAFPARVKEAWEGFLYKWLTPKLMKNHTFVRNTLRGIEALPCKDLPAAAKSLESHVREMSYPQYVRGDMIYEPEYDPPWRNSWP